MIESFSEPKSLNLNRIGMFSKKVAAKTIRAKVAVTAIAPVPVRYLVLDAVVAIPTALIRSEA